MALGYETTGTGPNIIANAGNAMAADIRRIGEVIRKDIQQHNQDKQVFGFLQEAKMLRPESETFQQDLVGVFAKYPSAAQDQRALTGAKFLHDAWQQKQLKDKMLLQFGQQKTLQGMRTGGLYGDSPMRGGIPEEAPLGSPQPGFGFGGGARGGLSVSPDLPVGSAEGEPDLMAGLGPLDSTLRNIPGLPAREGARVMARAAGQQFANQQRGAKPITRSVPGVGLVQYDPETETWNTAVEAKRPRQFRSAGDRLVDVETGEEIKMGIPPAQQESLNLRKAAGDTAKTEKLTARALKNINSEIDEKERDITSLESSIRGRQKQKERTPAEDAELGKWQEQHAVLRAERDILQKERSELGTEKTLDRETAAELLREVGGDKEKARELARSRGYSL